MLLSALARSHIELAVLRAITGVGIGGMLASVGVINQRPAAVVPKHVVTFKVAVADAFANQVSKQLIQRLQLGLRGITALLIRRKTFDDVWARQILGHQKRLAAQP